MKRFFTKLFMIEKPKSEIIDSLPFCGELWKQDSEFFIFYFYFLMGTKLFTCLTYPYRILFITKSTHEDFY